MFTQGARHSIYDSSMFRAATTMVAGSVLIAVYVFAVYWPVLTLFVRLYLFVATVGIFIVWNRMIAADARIREWLSDSGLPTKAQEQIMMMADRSIENATSLVVVIVALMLALGAAIKHYETVLGVVRHAAK